MGNGNGFFTMLRLLAAAGLAAAAFGALAQSYPSRPIRILVPFSVGTPPDIVSRIVSERLQAALGQTIIVENRTGATGTIAMSELARQPADGYTALTMPMPLAVAPALYPNFALDVRKDFEPVGQMVWSYNALVVHPSVPAMSVKQLVDLLRQKPGQLSFASGGNGTPAHLAGELFKQQTGISAIHVPYVQFPQAVGDVVAGRVQFMFIATGTAIPQIAAGKMRALAVTGPSRVAALEDVPTMTQEGFPDFVVRDWQGLIVRAGTPREIVGRLNAELGKVMALAEVHAALAKLGNEPAHGTPQQLGALINSEVERWARVVQAAGIKID